MKIGFVSYHSFLKPGGVKSHIFSLKKEFSKRKIKVKIIVPKRKKKENYGKEVIFLGRSIPAFFLGTEGDCSFALNFKKISKTLKRERFDILHFHNFGPLSYQILEKSKSLNILTVHTGYGKKELRNEKLLKKVKFKGKRKIFKILSKIVGAPLSISQLEEKIREKIDGIIATSTVSFKLIEDFNCPKEIIPNGIDLEKFNPKGEIFPEFKDGKINILFLSRIEKRKGLIYLLKAFQILLKRYSNLRLLIGGEGDDRKRCEEFVKKAKLKEVKFLGKISSKEAPSFYRTGDIFVAPAIYGESFGIILLEAMACGVPTVAFANPGYKFVMEGKYKKFLVKPKDFRKLAEKIEIFIKNRNEREKMKEFGFHLVKKYNWDKISQRVLNFYQKVKREKI